MPEMPTFRMYADDVGLPAFPSRLPKRNNQDNSPAVEVGIRHQRVLEDLLGIVWGYVRHLWHVVWI